GAVRFYGELCGWRKGRAHDMGASGVYQIFEYAGNQAGGICNVQGPSTPPSWLSYVHVADANRAVAAAKAAGGRLMHGPMEVPGGSWIALLMDPQGGAFAVQESPRTTSQPRPATAVSAPKPATAPTPRRAEAGRGKEAGEESGQESGQKSGQEGAKEKEGGKEGQKEGGPQGTRREAQDSWQESCEEVCAQERQTGGAEKARPRPAPLARCERIVPEATARCSPNARWPVGPSDSDQRPAEVPVLHREQQVRRSVDESLDDVLLGGNAARPMPGDRLAQKLAAPMLVVAHPDTQRLHALLAGRVAAAGEDRLRVLGLRRVLHDAPPRRQVPPGDDGVEELPAGIVEIDVHAARRELFQPRAHVLRGVVDAGRQPRVARHPVAS